MTSSALGLLGWALPFGLWLSACGSNVTYSGSSATSSGSGSGVAPGPGACTSNADCPNGSSCLSTSSGVLKVCAAPPPQAMMCHSGVGPDQCCTTKDCTKGACYDSGMLPSCGGPAMTGGNRCYRDECTSSGSECAGEGTDGSDWVCLPPGAFGFPQRRCFRAWCQRDSDCVAAADGACRTMIDSCCSYPKHMACVYPGGCTKDADCGSGRHCDLGACKPGDRVCPL